MVMLIVFGWTILSCGLLVWNVGAHRKMANY